MVITVEELKKLIAEQIPTIPNDEVEVLANALESLTTQEKKDLANLLINLTNIGI